MNNSNFFTKQGDDIKKLAISVDYVFKELQKKAGRAISYEEEQTWKKLFDEKIILTIDSFLDELAEETDIKYNNPTFVEELKKNQQNT